jgi:MFS family permease
MHQGTMSESPPRASRYRWVILAVFMLVGALNQLGWITFAPITVETTAFYGVSSLAVGLLSLSFMAVYLLLFLPAAWVIDTLGFRTAVGLGAALTAIGALGRGIFSTSFSAVLAFQLVLAAGQPFVLGAITTMAARWFPPGERATASGLGTLAIYIGVLAGVWLTPLLLASAGMRGMLLVWGILSAAAALGFFLAARERPPGSAAGAGAQSLVFDGMRGMMRQKDFILLLAIFFVGLGAFNGVTTWIEEIAAPRGFTAAQAGAAGAVMLGAGIIGAAVLPLISDATRRRKPFMILALAGIVPGLIGIGLARGYGLLLASAAVFGFFLLSSGPVGFQYGAEITAPAPEGTSNTLLLLMGQISGMAFIFLMDALRSPRGPMTASILGLAGLVAVCLVLSLFLRESPISRAGRS